MFQSVSEAVAYLTGRFSHPKPRKPALIDLGRFKKALAVINIGLEAFYMSLVSQGAQAVQVDWRPPAGGNERIASLLEKMKTHKSDR